MASETIMSCFIVGFFDGVRLDRVGQPTFLELKKPHVRDAYLAGYEAGKKTLRKAMRKAWRKYSKVVK